MPLTALSTAVSNAPSRRLHDGLHKRTARARVEAHLARMLAFDFQPGVMEWRCGCAAQGWYWTREQQADLMGELPGPPCYRHQLPGHRHLAKPARRWSQQPQTASRWRFRCWQCRISWRWPWPHSERRAPDLPDLCRLACLGVERHVRDEGAPSAPLPDTCPWTLDELLAEGRVALRRSD
jgi:hypothetical protein